LAKAKRLTSPLFTWYGIAGCAGLVVAMPHAAVLTAAGVLAALTVTRFAIQRTLARNA